MAGNRVPWMMVLLLLAGCSAPDECVDQVHNCDENATCETSREGFTCACDLGYEGDGVTCSELDECTLETDNCSDDATCSNTPGTFECTCEPGYEGDGVTCTDLDECSLETDNCSDDATCGNTPGAFECTCDAGFEGDGVTCTDLDECSLETDNCSDDATCSNTPGTFECSCEPGYEGDGVTCADLDECTLETDNCSDDATCSNTPSTFECSCDAGFEGDGVTCTDLDECSLETDNCSDDATCSNTPGTFECSCDSGYEGGGVTCTDLDECTLETDNCGDDATCGNTPGTFECTCDSGYEGDGVTCTDIDECNVQTDSCSDHATCGNTPGTFECTCDSGYEGDGATCTDIDECSLATDDCTANETCTNTTGGFLCSCLAQFYWDGVECVDVDECSLQTDNCGNDATCANTPGTFECTCDSGYEGDGITCTDIDECATNNGGCGDPSTVGCTNTPGGYSCAGLHYYVCDCETGADPDCVAGADTNPGTNSSAPWQTVAAGFGQFSSLPAGGSIQFCQGGAFQVGTEGGTRLVNSAATAAVPVSLTDYQPTWASGDEGRPVLHQEEPAYGVITLLDGGYPEHHEGVLVENLELRATTGTGFAIFIHNDQDHVLIDNVLIDGFDIGVYSAGSNECASSDPGCDRDNENITLRSSTITNNTSQGWLGGGDHILIENNYFEGNGTNTDRDHNIYISGHPKTDGKLYTENYQIIGNTLYRSALDTSGACIGAPIVGHGNMRDVLIEGNLVYEDIGKAGGGCWGIAIDGGYSSAETLENVIIRGNYLYNVGNLSIGVGSCVDCIIENNVISNEQPLGLTAIGTSNAPGIGDALTENLVVRNNSIYLAGTGRTYPISISAGEGDNYTIVSNTIESQGPTPDIWQHDFACLLIEDVSEMTEVDYNLCEFQAGAYAGWYWWGASGTMGHTLSLQDWQLQEGFGLNSVQASPGYTAPTSPQFDLSPSSSSSPLIGAGHPTLSSTADILGNTRDAAPDIGAFEGP